MKMLNRHNLSQTKDHLFHANIPQSQMRNLHKVHERNQRISDYIYSPNNEYSRQHSGTPSRDFGMINQTRLDNEHYQARNAMYNQCQVEGHCRHMNFAGGAPVSQSNHIGSDLGPIPQGSLANRNYDIQTQAPRVTYQNHLPGFTRNIEHNEAGRGPEHCVDDGLGRRNLTQSVRVGDQCSRRRAQHSGNRRQRAIVGCGVAGAGNDMWNEDTSFNPMKTGITNNGNKKMLDYQFLQGSDSRQGDNSIWNREDSITHANKFVDWVRPINSRDDFKQEHNKYSPEQTARMNSTINDHIYTPNSVGQPKQGFDYYGL